MILLAANQFFRLRKLLTLFDEIQTDVFHGRVLFRVQYFDF